VRRAPIADRVADPPGAALPDGLVEDLADAAGHPGDSSASAGVEHVQTHISHVFLTGERVVKLRKAVDLGFLDFSTRTRRNEDCLRELRLNRRMAPDVYLGVAPIVRRGERWQLGPLAESLAAAADGEVAEHAVVMRRLPDGTDAQTRLAEGRLSGRQLDAAARRVAEFHRSHGLGVPAPFSPDAWLEHVERPMRETLAAARDSSAPGVAQADVDALAARAHERFDALAARFEERRRAGRAVDAHGDLHLDHLWFASDDAEPVFIDCIEFSDDLRRIDAAAEVAFLAMDLRYRGHPELAERFLRVYAEAADDHHLYSVVDWYLSYRAAVRAKVAALAATDDRIGAEQRAAASRSAAQHLRLAMEALAEPGPGAAVLVCGTIGTGKSTAARALADRIPGVLISSDVVRKHRAGMAPSDRPRDPDRFYDESAKAATYAAMLERAEPVVGSGRVAILDATWERRSRRDAARDWAARREIPLFALELRADEAVVRERLAQRAAGGAAASDAGPELLARSRAAFEPFGSDAASRHWVVWTDAADWTSRLDRLAEAVAGRRSGGPTEGR